MKRLVLMLPNLVISSVWNTRAKTDVPQRTRPVRSHRTPGSRFSSASVRFTTPSSSPRAKKERKKERKRERKKERKRETRILTYPLHILISLLRVFFPHFFWRLPSREHTLNKEGGDHRHACLDELLRCGAVQAQHWGKCRRRWTTTLRRGGVSSSKASRRRCRDNKRDSMHARQEAAREKRRVRV